MKLTRKQLRRLIKETFEMDASDPSYDEVSEAIIQTVRRLKSTNMPRMIAMGMGHLIMNDIQSIVDDICDDYNIPQHSEYVMSKVVLHLQNMDGSIQ